MSAILSETLRLRQWGVTTLRRPWILMKAPKARLSSRPEPVIASRKPFKVDLAEGKRYSWCTCGHSVKQPFCDGSHKTKGQGFTPLRFVAEKDEAVWLCGCKYTGSPPRCDGTHKQDFVKLARTPPEQADS